MNTNTASRSGTNDIFSESPPMSPAESLQSLSRTVEQTAAHFGTASRQVTDKLLQKFQEMEIELRQDGPTCAIVRFYDRSGRLAILSLEPDFSSADVTVIVMFAEDSDDDLSVHEMTGPDPVIEGMNKIQSLFSKYA